MNELKDIFRHTITPKGVMSNLLMLAGLMVGSFQLSAQGWEIYFGGNSDDQAFAVTQTKDNGYAVVGFSESFASIGNPNDNDIDVYVVRTDVDGRALWSYVYDEGFVEHGNSIIETPDGGFFVVGDIQTTQVTNPNVYLLKLDKKGKQQFSKQFGGSGTDIGYKIIPVSTGGYLIIGKTNSSGNGQDDTYIIKVDAQGNQSWSKTFGTTSDDAGRSGVEVADGFLITGYAWNSANNSQDLYLLKIDFEGNLVWEKFFGTDDFDKGGADIIKLNDGNLAVVGTLGSSKDAWLLKLASNGSLIWEKFIDGSAIEQDGNGVVQSPNGDIVIVGSTIVEGNADINILLARVDNSGNEVWVRNFGRNNFTDEGFGIAVTRDSGFIVAGYNSLSGAFINDFSLVKVHGQGTVYTNYLQGKVFIDDNDCILETGEQGLNDWIVKAASPSKTFFGTTDINGNFDLTVDNGDYEVTVLTKNSYWNSCVASYNVSYAGQYDTLVRNFPILKVVNCPLLSVDVTSPSVGSCTNIGYEVRYCNDGTIASDMTSVQIILDNDLTLNGSSIPIASNVDSLYIFDIGSLGVGECDTFSFTVASPCTGLPATSYSVSAHIFPDTICLPTSNWDMASVDVNGWCDLTEDSVRFTISNEGIGNMTAPLNFIVIEDDVMLTPANGLEFQLQTGQDTTFSKIANGSTYRVIAQQTPNHPGNSYPTVAVEGCSNTGSYSTGYTTMFHENENDPFVSIDVQEIVSSTDYIVLRGYPKGYVKDGKNLIPPGSDIEYHLFFQNAGTDTIDRLVIRDTLPPSLDLGTVRAGASSHAYDFEIYGNGILKFTFDNLSLLPGGGAASQGFVKFKVSQKPGNLDETVISNSAAVFLGYDAPAQTAVYEYEVCEKFFEDCIEIISDIKEPLHTGIQVKTFPNPFASAIEFEVMGMNPKTLTINIFDISGKLVGAEKSAGNRLRFERNNLPSGFYTYRLESEGLLLDTGKLIIR